MEPDPHTPPECFQLEELQALQAFEAAELIDVNYYLWLNNTNPDGPYRFLYSLELIFDRQGALILSAGEQTKALGLISAETLIKTARDLQTLHRNMSIQRVHAGSFPLWEPAIGKTLHAVRLARNASDEYLNDSMVLDFGTQQVLIQLAEKDGLELAVMEE